MKGFFKVLLFLFTVFWVFNLLITAFRQAEEADLSADCADYSETDPTTLDRTHHRTWQLVNGYSSFCSYYQSQEAVNQRTADRRNQIDPKAIEYKDYWGAVYRELVSENETLVSFLADSLERVATLSGLEREQLAGLVVSFVQDIPYHFISSTDCPANDTGGKPCVGNARFGILSPYEFIHTLAGDCDTRAVLLYTMLRQLGFDPIIVISYEYRHAMLALNAPSSGDHVTVGHKKYYFWETTATGWPLGMLPPDMQNLNYWEIALINEL